MLEMTIESIRVSMLNYQRVVILKEKLAERYLPIWIGPAEADAIAVKLQDVSVPRPLTHDLLGSVISALGATVSSIIVNDLRNDTFFAKIILSVDGRQVEIDSRPSDAIALAVRVKVPIFAEESVLDKAGIIIDPQTGKPAPAREIPPEELERMSAFRDFIESLDLSDFEKRDKGS
jgi:bifunctional DNase/RNase